MGWNWASIDWAATWGGVQGLAATGALVFVVVQVTRDGRVRRDKNRSILLAAYLATWLGRMSVASWADHAAPAGDNGQRHAAKILLGVSNLQSMLAELRELPLHELPTPLAVKSVLKVRAVLALMVAEANAIVETGLRRPDFPKDGLIGLAAAEADLRAACLAAGLSVADLEAKIVERPGQ